MQDRQKGTSGMGWVKLAGALLPLALTGLVFAGNESVTLAHWTFGQSVPTCGGHLSPEVGSGKDAIYFMLTAI